MSRLHSFMTLLWLVTYSQGMPLIEDDEDEENSDCWSESPQRILSTTSIPVPDSPSASILAPYERPQLPHPSPSQHLHATLPVSDRSQTPAILGTVFGILIAVVALFFTTRYVVRRRPFVTDPFRDPPGPGFAVFRLKARPTGSKKRLSDESWVSPPLPMLGPPGSPPPPNVELGRYAIPRRKLVPVTTPVCTPTDTEFGSRLESGKGNPSGSVVAVRVPSPVYISPFSPSPTLSSSSSSLSPTPSTEPLVPPSLNPVRLSRLLSSTFGVSHVIESPARPTTAHLIHTARSYAHAYRPSSTVINSLYAPPTLSTRVSGTRSRTSLYPGPTGRETFSTVTTSDTITVPHLFHATAEDQPPTSSFVDLGSGHGPSTRSANAFAVQSKGAERQMQAPVGTLLGLKLRLSDASEHAHYRLRERERERERQGEREGTEERLSAGSCTVDASVEFRLRDSQSVLHEFGW